MAKTKEQKRREALDRLVPRIAASMNSVHGVTFSQRLEYNALKRSLGEDGKLLL